MDMSDYIAATALAFAVNSFVITTWLNRRTKRIEQRLKEEELKLYQIAREEAAKAEILKALQGEKESVGFTAMHFARVGLPADQHERDQVITSLVQAAVFSGSDRARAMIYHVLRTKADNQEVAAAVQNMDRLFGTAEAWGLDPEELDLERGLRRIEALKKALRH